MRSLEKLPAFVKLLGGEHMAALGALPSDDPPLLQPVPNRSAGLETGTVGGDHGATNAALLASECQPVPPPQDAGINRAETRCRATGEGAPEVTPPLVMGASCPRFAGRS